jgi:hypothetical protein
MSLEARYELFGDTSELLVQEAAWLCRDEDDQWPTEQELVDRLVEFAEVESSEDAGRRLELALHRGEAELLFDDEFGWLVSIDQATQDAISRRLMDRRMPRRDKEETW